MRERRPLYFLPLTPLVVALAGIAAAIVIGVLGVVELRIQSDASARLRSEVLAVALAKRLRGTALEDQREVVERAASRSGAELLLVSFEGDVQVDGSLARPNRDAVVHWLLTGSGEARTGLGRTLYHVAPLPAPMQHLSVVTFVSAPPTPFATGPLVRSVGIFAVFLVGAAALVALSLARDVHGDVTALHHRIADMAQSDGPPAGQPVPVTGADEVALLTSAFNALVQRFAAAERTYRDNLARTVTFERDRSVFLAALSHELRTPLNSILGFADVLLSEAEGPLSPEGRENLEVIHSSGQHLRSLIDDILALSALESGELRLERQETNVFAIAAEVVREAKISARGKPVAVQLAGQAAIAWADPLRVRQILGNVVGNAVKFTQRGSVLVFVEANSERVVASVTDTGPGVPPAQRALIFDEYRQAGDLASRRAGSGLGLAITRRLVQMHDGTIVLESEVDVGSRFTISFPRRPRPDSHRPSEPSIASDAPPVVEERHDRG
ncbi:MAG: HAMP domain-containing histidine kinase [Polyangiaceae bacterium]|nr:HAMP domain-containing histidine kinase [Polyangiaceae bacterium]